MSIEKIREIELKYAVEDVRANGFQVWPMVRFWLWAYYAAKVEPIRTASSGFSATQILKLLASVFYGFSDYFRKYDYFVFSDSSERRLMEGKYVDKSIDHISNMLSKSLVIELPLPQHYPRSATPTRCLVSKIPLYLLEWVISKLKFRNVRIHNEDIIIQILNELGIAFDYRSILIRNLAQQQVGKLLNRIYKPKGVIIQCAYTNTGFVKAFRDQGIPVIEVQHGMLSASHVAYNVFAKLEETYFPDYFLSYGHREKEFFSNANFYIAPYRVFPVGHYYLDMIGSSTKTVYDYLPEGKQFKNIVCVTGQNLPELEQRFIDFLKLAAPQCVDTVFIYVPRNNQSVIYNNTSLPANFLIIDNKDTYELIRLATIHITMFSTCAIESLALGTPNLLINLDNQARIHYGPILKEGSTQFIDTVEELITTLNSGSLPERWRVISENSDLITNGYRKNIGEALQRIFNSKTAR